MKIFILFLAIIQINIIWSQNGFTMIRKAEKQFEKGNLKKALKLLDKADSMDYGFCGNARYEADEAIAFNRLKIYDATGDYIKAANELNSINYYYRGNVDSLKIIYFIKGFDKQIIKREIDSCIATINNLDSIDFFSGLDLNVNFSEKPFHISYETLKNVRKDTFMLTEENRNIPMLNRFQLSLIKQPFYLLLIE